MRKFVLPILLLAFTGCTPGQREAWLEWFSEDPDAAVAFAQEGCAGLGCSVDDGSSGTSGNWTDVTTDEDIFDVPEEEPEGDGIYWPWDALAECESGGNWYISTGNGYYGGIQFSLGSWQAAGGSLPRARPGRRSARRQILQDMQGWNAWPSCARQIGLI